MSDNIIPVGHRFGDPLSIHRGRITTYKGIRMRSRLEASVAARLDREGAPWIYEPECFADESGQYLPDFRVEMPDGTPMFVEAKPLTDLLDVGPILDQMEIIRSSIPGACFAVIYWSSDRMVRFVQGPSGQVSRFDS